MGKLETLGMTWGLRSATRVYPWIGKKRHEVGVTLEVIQIDFSIEEIGHVDIPGVHSCSIDCGCHLPIPVTSLFPGEQPEQLIRHEVK